MPGPEFLKFVRPVVEVLREIGGSGRASEVTDLVIERLAIPEEELAETTRTGIPRVRNQIAWARMYLVNDGVIDPSRYGIWQLTDRAATISLDDDNDVLSLFRRVQDLHKSRREAAEQIAPELEENIDDHVLPASGTPSEQVLQVVRQLPPEGFERLCQRLLREAGFERVTVTGRSNDGGIDGHGLVQVNPFVSFKVLFQCKCYTGSVRSSQVRDFRGAMAGRADKGLILTTGSFTAEARREAHRDGVHPIELVDGDQLLEMLAKYGLGMRPTVSYELDTEFFVQFGGAGQLGAAPDRSASPRGG